MTYNGRTYGLVVEFENPTNFLEAARKVRKAGYKRFEVYSPYPIKDLDRVVPGGNKVPLLTLTGGLLGAATAWILQYYVAAIEYPTNIGGRPLYSWPSFVPILFELTVLLAAGFCFFGTLWLCGFPRLHHPVFNLERFAQASSGRFFLAVEGSDSVYDDHFTADFLNTLKPLGVWEVENT